MMNATSAPIPFKTGQEIREAFLAFFEKELGHRRLPSASLVPHNNPTVLLTPAGMLPFAPIFLGLEPIPNPPRATSSQKCARVSGKASDLRAVGRTPCHHTFFEMLGNFSFGDYFKADVIPWAWRFCTEVLQLPADRLWVTVHHTDDEARAIWRDVVGVPAERILTRGDKDNFWGPPGPTGPCGPCTEIYFDTLRPDAACPAICKTPAVGEGCHPDVCETVDCRRYMEIWNLVFMQYFQNEAGERTPLEKQHVDTGMGLERVTMVVQDKTNTFETDLLAPLVEAMAGLARTEGTLAPDAPLYTPDAPAVACRIVADHLRFLAFAMADGVLPSNEGRGYILRMILRRAFLQGYQWLGVKTPFLSRLLPQVAAHFGAAYPELPAALERSVAVTLREEQRFLDTLERGLSILDDMLAHPADHVEPFQDEHGQTVQRLRGASAFKLYDTYGFPLDLTLDLLEARGMSVDIPGYDDALAHQRQTARQGRKQQAIVSDTLYGDILQEVGPTEFVGYEGLDADVTVRALMLAGEQVSQVHGTNTVFEMVLDRTPFYPEGGGQVGDRGSVVLENGHQGVTVLVLDTVKKGELIIHRCKFDQGDPVAVGLTMTAHVDPRARQYSAWHHTATHLLNAALRKVLDPKNQGLIQQAGSHVSPDGARFDFTFDRGLTRDELSRAEFIVNKMIRDNHPASVLNMPIDEAKAAGAIAMFDEKYGDTVRVVAYGDASKELCGGTHVRATGDIGLVKLLSESSIAAGVRRIEFVAGELAYKQFKHQERTLNEAAATLNTPADTLADKIAELQATLKAQEKQIQALQLAQHEATLSGWKTTLAQAPDQPHVFSALLQNTPTEILKKLGDQFATASQHAKAALLLASLNTDTQAVQFLVVVSPALVAQGIQAGTIVKALATACGGGGGGKPNLAMAGGKLGGNAEAALDAQVTALRASL